MPVAYVKFTAGPMNGKKTIVDINKIKDFNQKTHKSNIKYKIEYYDHVCKGVILLQANSKEEMEKIIVSKDPRRISNLPSKLLVSASENDSDVENKSSTSNVQASNVSKNSLLERRLEVKLKRLQNDNDQSKSQTADTSDDLLKQLEYENTADDKNDDTKSVHKPKLNKVNEETEKVDITQSESNNIETREEKNDESQSQLDKINNMDEELTTNNNTTETRDENNDKSQSQLDNMEADLSNKSRLQLLNNKENGNESIGFKSHFTQFIEKQKTNDIETEFVKNKISRKETEYKLEIQTNDEQSKKNKIQVVQTKSDKIKPKLVRNEIVEIPFQDLIKIKTTSSETKKKVPANFQSDKEVPALQTDGDISTLKNTIKKLKSENAKLEKRKKELKLQLEEKVKEIQRLMDLNENLQNHLSEKCEEQKDEIRKLANGNESTNDGYDSNFPSFLRTRTTDNIRRVHIGNDEWIPEIACNRINAKSTTARQLAGNILIAVFDEEILLTSTITGNESNKKGKGNRNSVKKLDEKKINACEKLYEHLLQKLFSKFKTTKKVKGKLVKVNLEDEKGLFNHYAQKKIVDLKTVKVESTSGTKRKRDDHKEIAAKRVKKNVEEDSNEIIDHTLNGAPVSQEIDKDAQVPEEIVDKDELNNKHVSQGADKGTFNLSDHEDELFDWSPKSQDQLEDATTAVSSDEES